MRKWESLGVFDQFSESGFFPEAMGFKEGKPVRKRCFQLPDFCFFEEKVPPVGIDGDIWGNGHDVVVSHMAKSFVGILELVDDVFGQTGHGEKHKFTDPEDEPLFYVLSIAGVGKRRGLGHLVKLCKPLDIPLIEGEQVSDIRGQIWGDELFPAF